ncbi:hypothetical protein [Lentzea sp. NPDC003310]|uniref:hypothetical protein n=1 Tax=Lentzea sp. NPDC003310 TaxID=3154447 RepID=UPI0033A3461B
MRKRSVLLSLGTVLASIALVLAPSTANAAAEPAATPAGVSVSGVGTAACRVAPAPGVSGVNVRLRADAGSTRLGIIQPGQSAVADCSETTGKAYTACGGVNTPRWIGVTWNGRRGYVARWCVDWWVV